MAKDQDASTRGRLARRRGVDFERKLAKKLGLTRVGHHGGKPDAVGKFVVQCKKGDGYFSDRYWQWIMELPEGGPTRLLAVADNPKPGEQTRVMIVCELEEFSRLVSKEDSNG